MTIDPNQYLSQFYAQGGQAAPGGNDPSQLPVWMGTTPENPRQADLMSEGRVDGRTSYPRGEPPSHASQRSSRSTGPVSTGTKTIQEVLSSFYSFSESDIQKLRRLAERAGFKVDYMSLRSFWEEVTRLASESYILGGKKMTPWDAAEALAADQESISTRQEPQTSRDAVTDITNPESAAYAARTMFEERLGRKATDQEVQAFVEALGAYERANPSITQQMAIPGDESMGLAGDTSVVRQGGADPRAFADRWFEQGYGDQEQVRKVATEYSGLVDRLIGGGML